MEKEKTILKILKEMHFNFRSEWNEICKKLKAVGVKTFGEIEMYCKVHKITNQNEFELQLCKDYLQTL